jgi:hypothetical protein
MRTVELTCDVCGKTFERNKNEHVRSLKLGRRMYCSRHCCGIANAVNLPDSTVEGAVHLNPANKRDDLSPFRWHFRNTKRRNKDFNLTLQDIKDQWELQGGVCPYTGWHLKNMPTTNLVHQLPLTPDRASLDRIDSTKGYVPGNIQFVSIMAQYAKNCFSEQQLLDFCKQVVTHAQLVRPDQIPALSGTSCAGSGLAEAQLQVNQELVS